MNSGKFYLSESSIYKTKKPYVILVDDNEIINNSNKNIINKIFKQFMFDFDILLLNDGIEVIRLVLDFIDNYSLIKFLITDENMDIFSGSEGIKFIRKLEKRKNVNTDDKTFIFSLTCQDDQNMKDYILDCGANVILSKPMSKDIIEKHILELLKKD